MNKAGTKISILTAMLFALIIAIAAPATASAQGNKHARGRGNQGSDHNNRRSNYDKKCAKFVNCHDASDGRRDGRGPTRQAGFWRNGVFVPRGTRVFNRNTSNRRTNWTLAQRRAWLRRNR
ncbi:MAG: hypothetical protein ABI596_02440 [Pyrinomonadaceae bacterium]